MTEADQKKGFPFGLLVLLPFVLLVVYVGATGPLNWLLLNGYLAGDLEGVLMYVYSPLRYLMENSETFTSFIMWYDSLFNGA